MAAVINPRPRHAATARHKAVVVSAKRSKGDKEIMNETRTEKPAKCKKIRRRMGQRSATYQSKIDMCL